jgi:MFS family permease
VFGGLLLLGARAGDITGRRRMFVIGLVLFGLASFLVGAAPAAWWLIAARRARRRRHHPRAVGLGSSYLSAVPVPMVLIGTGQGLAFAPMTSAGLAGVNGSDAGAASGLINTFHQLGSALASASSLPSERPLYPSAHPPRPHWPTASAPRSPAAASCSPPPSSGSASPARLRRVHTPGLPEGATW